MRKGDLDAASKIPQGTLGTSTGVSKTKDNELSLIDLDGDPIPTSSHTSGQDATNQSKQGFLEDDLLGLSMQDHTYGQSGGIALGFGANTSERSLPSLSLWSVGLFPRESDIPGPSLLSSSTQESTAKAPSPENNSQTPSGFVTAKPNYNPFSSLTTSHPSSRTSTPGPSSSSSKPAQVPQASPSLQPPHSDPFAILASPPARQASPMTNAPPSNLARPSPSASIFNFAPSAQPGKSASQSLGPPQQSNGATADDDWDFASALPDDNTQLPPANYFTLSKTSVTISFKISRPGNSDSVVIIVAEFSNNTAALITEYTFQVAIKVDRITDSYLRLPILISVVQGLSLRLSPQSGRTLQPHQDDAITQTIEINGVPKGQTGSVKMRWKASYNMLGQLHQEQGEVPALGIL